MLLNAEVEASENTGITGQLGTGIGKVAGGMLKSKMFQNVQRAAAGEG